MLGFGCAHVAEQRQGLLPPARGGGWLPGAVERVAEEHQGAGVAGTVAGVGVIGERLQRKLDGLLMASLLEAEVGQGGERLALQDAVADLAGQRERLPKAGIGLVELSEVLVGGGRADERDHLRVAGLGLARQGQGLLVLVEDWRCWPRRRWTAASALRASASNRRSPTSWAMASADQLGRLLQPPGAAT